MKWTGLNDLRESYLSFFESKGHLRLNSFPLVPQGDNSILLINAGMTPLKKYFQGIEEPPRHRVTTCQKCIRTPDIENVGKTARHGTYFEMLGNFSFGDYFKHEAIAWAWEYLTKVLEIPPERLWVTIYEQDDEAGDIWANEVGVPRERIIKLGKADNFWEHGSGPCGPCSEIHYDRGEKYGHFDHIGQDNFEEVGDCDRIIEIWNNVFTQFDNDGHGNYTQLKTKNIDTGMGLERLACVMQGVGNLFEVDTVQSVLHHVEHIAGKTYGENAKDDISIRVITDHIRSCTFMVSDGILPSNEGRGYVLRRLLRRAARHGRMLGISRPFLVELVETVIQSSESAYPELREHDAYIKKVIGTEEANFARTIDAGMNILNNMIDGLEKAHQHLLKGLDVFKLNDTFGFPLDLTKEIAAEQGIEIDEDGFHAEMKKQKERARAERLKKNISGWSEDLFGGLTVEPTVFTGYETLNDTGVVVALSDEETLTDAIATDEEAKDGVLVVHHDDNLKRVCGVDRRIAQSTLAEVRACHLSGTDEVVPTFDEVLEAVGGRVPLIVELKVEQNVDSLCSAVRERMQRYNGLWCMESFDPRAVQWFRKNAPEIIRGQLAFGLGGEAAHKGVKPLTAFFISTLMQHVLSRPDFLAYEAISEHGLNLPMRLVRLMRPWMVAWTIRSQEALDHTRGKYDIAIFEGFVPPAKRS